MNRRSLILGAIAACGVFVTKRADASLSVSQKILSFGQLRRSEELANNQASIIKPGTIYRMPTNPKHGDHVHIVVDQSSLLRPSVLQDSKNKIIDDKELILDCMAIFKLTYNSNEKTWKHA